MKTYFTRRDYDQLPEGFPAQLVEGQLVKEPAPLWGHQSLVMAILQRALPLVGLGRIAPSPVDVGIDDHNVYQPDVVVLRERAPCNVRDVGIPWIAFEVLSPSTARRDRLVKRRRLIAAGTAEVWIVDPGTSTVEVHDAEGVRSATGAEAIASRALAGFSLVPAELFAEFEG